MQGEGILGQIGGLFPLIDPLPDAHSPELRR